MELVNLSKVISSFSQLYTEINGKLEFAIDRTINILLKELQQIITRDVYSRPSPSGENWHGRTYEFLESWNASQPMIVGNVVQSIISQDGYDFSWNNQRDEWSHGNGWQELAINSLDEIINNGLSDSNFNFPAIEARPYWDDFRIYCEENIDKIFMTQCKMLGLPLIKVGYKI